jgi:hypothetical protein
MAKIIGSRAHVWHGTATHTSGGLVKDDLMKNKRGRIVSKKKHALGSSAIKHLEKSGHKGVLPSQKKKKAAGYSHNEESENPQREAYETNEKKEEYDGKREDFSR